MLLETDNPQLLVYADGTVTDKPRRVAAPVGYIRQQLNGRWVALDAKCQSKRGIKSEAAAVAWVRGLAR